MAPSRISGAPDAKVKAAMASAKASRKPMVSRDAKYMFWMGGSLALVVAAVVCLFVNPDRGPFQTPVNDASLITLINRNAKTWRAAASSHFEGWTLGDVKTLEGVMVSPLAGTIQPCALAPVDVPAFFDARLKWPLCFRNPVFSMGNCTASWAIAAASALSNRLCLADPEKHAALVLSPQQLLSCDRANRGCQGGNIDTVWEYIAREGLVSETCMPYQAGEDVDCSSRCSTETPLKGAVQCLLNDEEAIKREVFQNGPVVAPLFLVDDILTYSAGIYTTMPTAKPLTDQRRQRIIHAVKIVGWGAEIGQKYWVIENSFGEDWGEQGYARIAAGSGNPDKGDSVLLTTFALAGTPQNPKFVVEDGLDLDQDLESDNEDDMV